MPRSWKVVRPATASTMSPVTALPAAAAQNAICAQLGRLIDRVPAGGEIQGR